MKNKLKKASQLRRLLLLSAQGLDTDAAMQVACIFEAWSAGRDYTGGEYFTYGENAVGDPQLYRVNEGMAHRSREEWIPGTDAAAALYTAIGLDTAGYPIWSAPTGAHDAYDLGDTVNYGGTLYVSEIDGNCTAPGEDSRFWRILTR